MIASLILWLYAGLLFYLYGAATLILLRRWLGESRVVDIGYPLATVVGMAQVTSLATLLSLVMPLAALSSAILLVVGLALAAVARLRIAWRPRLPRRSEWWLVLVVVLAVAFCLETGTAVPSNPDTNAYHAQSIRWIETFRAVPGLGNLYGRLAYNSSWLLLTAAFSFAYLNLQSFHVLGGLLFLVCVLEFLSGVRGLMAGDSSVANWMRVLFILAAFWIFRGEMSSPGTDLPAILLTWMLLSRAMQYEAGGAIDRMEAVFLAFVPALLTVFKLSAAPLAILSVYLVLRSAQQRDARAAWGMILLAALTLGPWMAHSVVLSGYPVYLYPQIDLFNPDWKIPATDVEAVRNGILGWARRPMKDWGEALRMAPWEWIPEWISQRTINQLVILALAFAAPAALLWRDNRKYAAPVIAAWLAMLVWFFGAPNWRFGYGVVFGLAAFVLALGLSRLNARLPKGAKKLIGSGLPVLLSGYLAITLAVVFDPTTLGQRVLLPMDYSPSQADSCGPEGPLLYCSPGGGSCGYSVFPCVPGIPKGVLPRGAGIQDGFYSISAP